MVAVGALLLIHGFFGTVGVEVALRDLKLWSAPTAGWVLAVGWWRYRALDRRLDRWRTDTRAPADDEATAGRDRSGRDGGTRE